MTWPVSERTAILDNSGGGYSSLAHGWSRVSNRPLHDLDALLWRQGNLIWSLASVEDYDAQHLQLISQGEWVIDGIGRPESLLWRLSRATYIILVDLPLWTHFSRAAERQVSRVQGTSDRPGRRAGRPNTHVLFEMMLTIDRDWMTNIHDMVAAEEKAGKPVLRITSLQSLENLAHEYFMASR